MRGHGGSFLIEEQDAGDAGHRAVGGKLERIGLVGRARPLLDVPIGLRYDQGERPNA